MLSAQSMDIVQACVSCEGCHIAAYSSTHVGHLAVVKKTKKEEEEERRSRRLISLLKKEKEERVTGFATDGPQSKRSVKTCMKRLITSSLQDVE